MGDPLNRRRFMAIAGAMVIPGVASAAAREIWSALEAAEALNDEAIVLLDVRSRPEWAETGLAKGAWPVSMHERGFEQRLFAARDFAAGKPVALICATGGRSARLLAALKGAGYTGFIDVSEGMLGSRRGPGWIARGLPMSDLETALAALPDTLR
ncbi:MAG: rhodanese-like domain-containing protein [Rhodobacteraceae bacterium]|nr:rhodanese-like domain-containing protein [Paracoccaceae bacterium]